MKTSQQATDGDLVTAVSETLARCRRTHADLARTAREQGVSVETVEAALVASVVADWMARHPVPLFCPSALATEGTRAAIAAGAGRPVTVALRVPALLAIRLVELAGEMGATPECAGVEVLKAHTDDVFARARAAHNGAAPRPWDGGGERDD